MEEALVKIQASARTIQKLKFLVTGTFETLALDHLKHLYDYFLIRTLFYAIKILLWPIEKCLKNTNNNPSNSEETEENEDIEVEDTTEQSDYNETNLDDTKDHNKGN